MSALGVVKELIQTSLPGARIDKDIAFSKDVEGCAFALHISHSRYEFVAVMDRNRECWLLGLENDYFDCEFQYDTLSAETFSDHLRSAAARTESMPA
ncbi:hypothetical protein [Allohahella marinimesophila]|uniref:Uncharacterized protein n=1 Tax=Allohahella marinimesophila TaxID=1054972 RepID=A0ABP7P484_9GAMM